MMQQTPHMNTPLSRSSRLPSPLRLLVCAALLTWSATPAFAQLAPAQVDPGALQRQAEERRRYLEEQKLRTERPADIDLAGPQAAAPVPSSGVRFVLNEVVFEPSTFLTQQDLQGIAASYVGREVDFAGLARMVEEVNALYRKQGIVTARAVIGAQKIENGVVRVRLVEARLEQIALQGAGYTRQDAVTGVFQDFQGRTLDTRVLEDRILRFNRGGELQVEASLRPGSSVGATDLLLKLKEPARYQARAFVNNEGPRSVGTAQVGIDAALNGPFGIGDKLSLYVARTRGATSGALSYAVPVNRMGGRLTASYSQGITDVVAGPYRALDINGKSKSLQLGMAQSLWRSGAWWIDLAGTLGKTRSDNQIGDLALSHTEIDNQTLGATATGAWDGRNVSLSVTATHAREQALATPERSFNLRQFRGSWVESMGGNNYFVLRGVIQDTNVAVLAPSLLFQVGGIGSVRGYEVGALSGDRGYLVNLEFHRALSDSVDASVFSDYGEVRTMGLVHQSVTSVGAAIDFQLQQAWQGNITAGRALKEILPGQSSWQVTGRLSYAF